jgi:cation transport regulator ChaC
MSGFVFGYGSLLEHPTAAGHRPVACELAGYRRTWNVAMENARTIPGYKYYLDGVNGERPDCFVTFLNIIREPGHVVNGVVFEVTPEWLSRLDHRERNYERIEVSGEISVPVDGRVWAYTGRGAAVARFETGLRRSRAVISRQYHDGVLADFERIGPEARQRFISLTDPAPCPIVDLRRIDVPEEGPAQRR